MMIYKLFWKRHYGNEKIKQNIETNNNVETNNKNEYEYEDHQNNNNNKNENKTETGGHENNKRNELIPPAYPTSTQESHLEIEGNNNNNLKQLIRILKLSNNQS